MFADIIQKIKANNYLDLKGEFTCKIPFSIDVLNALLDKAEDSKEAIKNLEVVSINGNEITFSLTLSGTGPLSNFDIVDRELILKIDPVLKAPNWLLQIDILDGIRRIENEIVEFLFNTWFKNSLIDFENRTVIVNHRELFDIPLYQFLLDNLTLAKLITKDNKLTYDLSFDFK